MFQHLVLTALSGVLPKMIVFMQERLKALTDIVWPEIALLVKRSISQAREEGIV